MNLSEALVGRSHIERVGATLDWEGITVLQLQVPCVKNEALLPIGSYHGDG